MGIELVNEYLSEADKAHAESRRLLDQAHALNPEIEQALAEANAAVQRHTDLVDRYKGLTRQAEQKSRLGSSLVDRADAHMRGLQPE